MPVIQRQAAGRAARGRHRARPDLPGDGPPGDESSGSCWRLGRVLWLVRAARMNQAGRWAHRRRQACHSRGRGTAHAGMTDW